ncbi:hypothetical protein ACFVFQ_30565 [Streptomyces sp. NPDC057743]|uniref:hypothetical protein n=1 Tax=Streptomyces sp. NPDC057743 TaxID=3346236 RepID=UPI003681F3E7
MTEQTKFIERPLVLRDDEAAQKLMDVSHTLNWQFIRDNAELAASEHVQETVWSPREQVFVHLVTDGPTRSRSVYVSSTPDAIARAVGVLEFLVDTLDFCSLDELSSDATEAATEKQRAIALVRLGMGAPKDYEERVFTLLEGGFRHPHPTVRNAAIWATRFALWPQFIPLMERMKDEDPEPILQSVAADTIEIYRESGVTSQ